MQSIVWYCNLLKIVRWWHQRRVLLTLCSKKCRKQNLLDDRKNPYTDEEYPDTKFDSVSYKEQVDIHVFNLFLSSSRMKFYNVERFQQGTAGTHHPQKPGHIALFFGSFPLLLERRWPPSNPLTPSWLLLENCIVARKYNRSNIDANHWKTKTCYWQTGESTGKTRTSDSQEKKLIKKNFARILAIG